MKISAPMVSLSVILLFSVVPAALGQEKLVPHEYTASANPLIEEMVSLDSVFREVVSAVALGDGARVQKALESMHGAMEKTHEGVHAGTVTLSKNNDRLKEFVEMDKKFHQKLEALGRAGQRNDKKEMLILTKQLLDRCVRCHRMFRS